MTLAQDLQDALGRVALALQRTEGARDYAEESRDLAFIESEVARLERIEEAARAWAGNLTFETTRDLLAAVAAEEGGDREAR